MRCGFGLQKLKPNPNRKLRFAWNHNLNRNFKTTKNDLGCGADRTLNNPNLRDVTSNTNILSYIYEKIIYLKNTNWDESNKIKHDYIFPYIYIYRVKIVKVMTWIVPTVKMYQLHWDGMSILEHRIWRQGVEVSKLIFFKKDYI